MEDNKLFAAIELLIGRVNFTPQISVDGLQNKDFPDEVILELHNSLGNAKHLIDDINAAFNASEQNNSIKASQKCLEEVSDSLFTLSSHNVLSQVEYDALAKLVHDVDKELRAMTDLDYT